MEKIFYVKGNDIDLETTVPVKSILQLDVEFRENDHGKGRIEVLVSKEYHQMVLNSTFCGDKITIIGKGTYILFSGLVEKIEFQIENTFMKAIIYCVSNTILMDRKVKRRSFQDAQMTYMQIINRIMQEYDNSSFVWQIRTDRAIKFPIIQYDETDWEFLKRLASHFHTVLYPEYQTPNITIHLGCKKGEFQEQMQDRHINIFRYGISDNYYAEGRFEGERSREEAAYLEVTDRNEWNIGDIIPLEGYKHIVYRKRIIFAKGEVKCNYLLGKDSFLYQKKKINKKLSGVSIKGEVKKREKENVYLQLEIDEEENAEYPWNWVPETGNLCYCMPEKRTTAVLYFASGDEKDGIALHTLRTNSESGVFADIKNREIHTWHDKKIALYPDQLFLEGKNKAIGIYLNDKNGVRFKSSKGFEISAMQGIYINGKKEVLSASMDIVCRTNQSNIEINRDINFYAPTGVQTNGKKSDGDLIPMSASTGRKPDHWQMTYSAMAAVPSVDFTQTDDDGVVDLLVEAAIPRIATGKTTLAMADVMEGIPESEARHSNALCAMELYTVKGGYPLPKGKE